MPPSTTPPTILAYTYNIGDPEATINLPAFTRNRDPPDLTNFMINYQLLKTNGATITDVFITSVDNPNRILKVLTSNLNLAAVYIFQMMASFNVYNPTYSQSITFTIELINICGGNQILTKSPIAPLYFQISEPLMTETFIEWTSKLPTPCGTFSYSLLNAPNGISL